MFNESILVGNTELALRITTEDIEGLVRERHTLVMDGYLSPRLLLQRLDRLSQLESGQVNVAQGPKANFIITSHVSDELLIIENVERLRRDCLSRIVVISDDGILRVGLKAYNLSRVELVNVSVLQLI